MIDRSKARLLALMVACRSARGLLVKYQILLSRLKSSTVDWSERRSLRSDCNSVSHVIHQIDSALESPRRQQDEDEQRRVD